MATTYSFNNKRSLYRNGKNVRSINGVIKKNRVTQRPRLLSQKASGESEQDCAALLQ